MRLSNEGILIIIVVRLIAGRLAGPVMRGAGFGLVGDLIVGCWAPSSVIGCFLSCTSISV